MIPLKNMDPQRRAPVVTVLLIVINCLVFFYQVSLAPHAANNFVMEYGLVPAKISSALAGTYHGNLGDALFPLFSSMFLHGGWLHLIGNMWFLWIFGGRVEDRLGSLLYLIFYIVCGLGSGIAQLLFSWGSNVPGIGASGAISGVLGAYIVFFPYSRILALVPLFVVWFTARIPAMVFIGLWFLLQFISGVGSLSDPRTAHMGGVAWWAHVGGFLLGVLLALVIGGASERRTVGFGNGY
jgi:membrane associated rhomboid family serine protease